MDISTLFQAAVVLNFSAALVMLGSFLTRKTYPGFGWWTLGVSLQAFGHILMNPGINQGPLIYLSSVGMIGFGYASLLRGLVLFRGIPWSFGIDAFCFLSFFSFYSWAYFQPSAIDLRIVIFSTYIGAVSLLMSFLSLKKARKHLIITDLLFSLGTFSFAVLSFSRSWTHLTVSTPTPQIFGAGGVSAPFVLIFILTLQLSTFVFLSMNSNRVELDYRESEENLRLAKNELQQSEDQLNLILNGVDAFIFIKDQNLRYQYFNRKSALLWDAPAESLLGLTDFDLMPHEIAEVYQKQDREIFATGERFSDDVVFIDKNKNQLYLHSIKIPLRKSTGEIYSICGVAYDVSERKKLENELEVHRENLEALIFERTQALQKNSELLRQSEERYAYAMEATSDGIWDWKIPDGQFYCNPAYAQMLGLEQHEMTNQVSKWTELLHPQDRDWVLQEASRLLMSPGHYQIEFRMRCRDGSYKWILSRGKTILRDQEGRPVRAVGTHVDLTPRKQLEIELREAKEAAESSNRLKSTFLANMSHEIRTPLNGAIGMIRLALQKTLDPQCQSYLEKALTSSQHLLSLLNDILDFSKIEAGKMQLDHAPFKIQQLAKDLEEIIRAKAQEKSLHLHFDFAADLPTHLVGDYVRILQILLNFTSNAIKFTEKVFVRVEARKIEETAQAITLKFTVVDSGIGLQESLSHQLFEIFQQADSSVTRKYGGTGLGLAISKRLAEMMGAQVGFSSQENQGSQFWFILSCEKIEDVALMTNSPLITSNTSLLEQNLVSKARILIVEDNVLNQEVAAAYLRDLNFDVTTANHGQEALQKLEANTFDLILMDIQMPVMDG